MSGSEGSSAPWYASEEAKRNLGSICREVFAMDTAVGLLGTPAEPLLVLERGLPAGPDDVEVSIDEARADWSNVTLAAAIYGTRFRIRDRRRPIWPENTLRVLCHFAPSSEGAPSGRALLPLRLARRGAACAADRGARRTKSGSSVRSSSASSRGSASASSRLDVAAIWMTWPVGWKSLPT